MTLFSLLSASRQDPASPQGSPRNHPLQSPIRCAVGCGFSWVLY